jgi:predicted DNA-binding protein
MSQITAWLPDELVAQLYQAVEYHLDDFEDISRAIEVLRDPADPVLDRESARHDLIDQP